MGTFRLDTLQPIREEELPELRLHAAGLNMDGAHDPGGVQDSCPNQAQLV